MPETPGIFATFTANSDAIFSKGHVAEATRGAFLRRLANAAVACGHLVRRLSSREEEEKHRIDWGKRQLNVMHAEILAQLGTEGFKVGPGEMGEQIVVAGVDPAALVPGARLKLGEAVIEVVEDCLG